MATTDRNTLKNFFKTGNIPTEVQFHALLDSYFHKNDQIPIEQINGINQLLTEINAIINNQSLTLSKTIDFTTSIPFNIFHTQISTHNVTGPLTFTINDNGEMAGFCSMVKLIGNGINIPNLSNFKINNNSNSYDNRVGILNCLFFFFDGKDYWVTIWQEKDAQANDTIAPEIQSAIIENSNTSRIKILYNETLKNVTPSTSSYSVSGNAVTNVAISGPYVLLDCQTPFTIGQSVQISYIAGVNKVQDVTGNEASNFSNYFVQNGTLSYTDIVFDNLSSGVTFDSNTKMLSSNNNSFKGGYKNQTLNISANFEVIHEIQNDASVLIIDSNIDNEYTWSSPQSHIAGIYKFQGTIYVSTTPNGFVVNSGQVTTTNNFAKLKKDGNNIVAYHSPDGINNWAEFHTITGALTGISQVYLKGLFAASGNLKIKGRYNE